MADKRFMNLPEFGTTLKFELLFNKDSKETFVSVIYDDDNISPLICGELICSFKIFESIITKETNDAPHYQEVCFPFEDKGKFTKIKQVDPKKHFK